MMTTEHRILKASKQAYSALRSIRAARDASQLEHGGANYSKTTEELNTAADTLYGVHIALLFGIASNDRREAAAALAKKIA